VKIHFNIVVKHTRSENEVNAKCLSMRKALYIKEVLLNSSTEWEGRKEAQALS